jgi:methylated-DNA-protein-cysteine methyltransferase related protein
MSYPTLSDPQPYYRIVWDIVRQVPRGCATTFGQIASMIPAPAGVDEEDYQRLGARWVGDAMNAVSRVDEPTVPWHRVINSKGGISLPSGSGSAEKQRARLKAEGVLGDNELVDLNQYGWEGPDASWLEKMALNKPRALRKPADDVPGQLRLF